MTKDKRQSSREYASWTQISLELAIAIILCTFNYELIITNYLVRVGGYY
ncbi:hypothetical protein H6H01_17565 [Nostoc calcicola FACHB-3891]|uniref:Uncharacterized protein n=1 Tax=Desmonostoc muscorum LEGE 12446 TaxID=1828758 RepID=A0A8J7A9D9_DESMC|nr:hypothetical protein [Desmonostoc muscorum]MBD2412515.1 hypothetical protein [Nostoc calcicola FACHB-3891]MCF2147003.1 hypothetical protein [Desmonostoc muscorum LEGE 12446]MDZ8058830.1 hypothetical protein [Nostoc sp. EkiNYC01]